MVPKSTPNTIANTFAGKIFKTSPRLAAMAVVAGLTSACGGGNYAAKDPVGPEPGRQQSYNPDFDESIFGEEKCSCYDEDNDK